MTSRAASETAAANGALVHLGEPPIASLTDDTHKARVLRAAFGGVRDAIQRKKDWNCCTAWCEPSREATESIGPLKNRFRMPPDCLRIRSVQDLAEDSWAVEAAEDDEEAMILVASVTDPLVCYTKRVVLPALWDAQFLEAFTLELARVTAPQIAKNKSLGDSLQARAKGALDDAAETDTKEKARGVISRNTSWIAARRGFRGGPR